MIEQAQRGATAAMIRRGIRDARLRTGGFAYLCLAYAYVQPVGFRHTYPTVADRLSFARGFGANVGLRLLYGRPYDLATVDGYVAWRVGGVLAIVFAAYGLFAATRVLRGEEESGRTELVLAGAVTRRAVHLAAAGTVSAGIAALFVAELVGLLAGRTSVTGAVWLAVADATVAAVFAAVGAVASQLAPTRRAAVGVAALVLALAFLIRVLADSVDALRWAAWLTPLGWAEQVRAMTGTRPAVLVLPLAATCGLVLLAGRLAAHRDIGAGVLRDRDQAAPRPALLGSVTGFTLRRQGGALATWAITIAGIAFVLGIVCNSVSSADVPGNVQRQLQKFGAGSIFTPIGYLGFVFVFVVVAVSAFACVQIAAARHEERGQLELVLAQPVTRTRWFAAKLLAAAGGMTALSLVAGIAAWLGTQAAGVEVSPARLMEAGGNALPTAVFFLGLAALAVAIVPRAGVGIAYGLLTVAFLWDLVGTLFQPPRWVLDLSPFVHVAPVPARPFGGQAALVLIVVGATAAVAAIVAFRRRDIVGS